MNLIEKTILILVIIFLMAVILVRSDRRTTEMNQMYQNCHQQVDIEGYYQLICGE
jgi:hypothetical protein